MSAGPNRIAVVQGADGESTQRLFAAVAADGRSAGLNVVGVIAETHGLPDRTCSAGILKDIASGARFPIYLETAPAGTACHLDAQGVQMACSSLLDQVQASDLVVLSKFGKLEAIHQGLFPAFEAALAAGKPLLTAVSDKHRDTWQAFAPDANLIEAGEAVLAQWWRERVEARQAAGRQRPGKRVTANNLSNARCRADRAH